VYAYEDVMGGGTKCDRRLLAPLYRERSMTLVPHILRDESLALFKRFFENKQNDYWKNSLLSQYTLAQK
jgi:tRNA(adenine34) deaminase